MGQGADVTARVMRGQSQMNVHAGGVAGIYAMLFPGHACHLITAERRARKGQLSAGIEDSPAEPESGGQEVTTMKLWTGLLFSLRDLLWRRT